MELRYERLALASMDALRYEAVIVSFFEDERPLRGAAGLCDWRMCGALSRAIVSGAMSGAFGEQTLVPSQGRLTFDKIVLFGLGPRAEFGEARYTSVVRATAESLARLRLRNAVAALPGRATGEVGPADAVRWLLAETAADVAIDELVLLDEPDAKRLMAPVVEAERRRLRAERELIEDAEG